VEIKMKRYNLGQAAALLIIGFLFGIGPIEAQQKMDGRLLMNNTVKRAALADDIIGAAEMVEPSWSWFSMCDTTNAWSADASAPAAFSRGVQYNRFGFDADGGSTGDDYVHLKFMVPAQYTPDTATMTLYWYHLDDNGAITDVVKWQGTVQAVGAGEDLYKTGTALTAVTTTCTASDSALYETTLNLEAEDIAAGDLVEVKFGVDESASSLDSGELAYLVGVLINFNFKN
jgi:hypothetical protein